MAIPEHLKRTSMDAIAHPETKAQMRLLRSNNVTVGSPSPIPAVSGVRSLIPKEVKRLAMNAISHVETVAQTGVIRMVGGIAVYAAKIREADRELHRDAAPRHGSRAYGASARSLGRD